MIAVLTEVRTASTSDAEAIASIYAPIVASTAISFEVEPPPAAAVAERIGKAIKFYPWLVAVRDGRVTGYAYAGPHRERSAYRWSVDVSVYVDAGARRLGIARVLYGRLLTILRNQNFRSAFAGIALPNDASVALHEAMGFKHLGTYKNVGFKLGQWRDVGWWQLDLSADGRPPEEPKPFEG